MKKVMLNKNDINTIICALYTHRDALKGTKTTKLLYPERKRELKQIRYILWKINGAL